MLSPSKGPLFLVILNTFRSVAFLRSTLVIGLSILFLQACSQVNPEISAVEELPALVVDPTTERFNSKNLQILDVTVTGRVSPFANRLQLSADGGGTWQDLNATMTQSLVLSQSSCSPLCPFSFSVIDVGNKWPTLAALPVNGEAEVLLRGTGQFGNTAPGRLWFKRIKGGFISIGSVGGKIGSKSFKKPVGQSYVVVGGKIEANTGRTLTGSGLNVKGAHR